MRKITNNRSIPFSLKNFNLYLAGELAMLEFMSFLSEDDHRTAKISLTCPNKLPAYPVDSMGWVSSPLFKMLMRLDVLVPCHSN